MNTPLYSALKKYIDERGLRLHMPGHIGGPGFNQSALKVLAEFDVTEIPGLDDLHAPQGIIEEARLLLAKAYGAQESFFLVNGASSGIHALFMALKRPDAKVLVPRNCHRSFFAGMVMAGTNPVYIPCQVNGELGAALAVSPADVEALLGIHHDAEAVFITSPSYYGSTCRIQDIAALCQKYQKPLFVDEAHGGHFCFHPDYPRPALEQGANAAVNGLHKTLPVYNQGAVLHVKGHPDTKRLRSACSLVTTTSPSYPILASIDLARNLMEERGRELLEAARIMAVRFRTRINMTKGLKAYDEDELKKTPGVFSLDPLKILIAFPGLRLNGFEISRILRMNIEYR
ncbi:aminotransferase class I/II-fold pyridoxal phosphate-dependent enzyme [Syntrophomonas palmitatica]|uniref:aminotransferase class I/II-fold pyridoxal phosphate-dependent enzyme n=1 Tax=Syntrophomonas palmitatica TaxID=402877 RepID=UPI0012EE210C|nr:aminotransferase class I/II-fold pyridoxal phosphate-dependent enzyme [Syntrophomonas palmitatica]